MGEGHILQCQIGIDQKNEKGNGKDTEGMTVDHERESNEHIDGMSAILRIKEESEKDIEGMIMSFRINIENEKEKHIEGMIMNFRINIENEKEKESDEEMQRMITILRGEIEKMKFSKSE